MSALLALCVGAARAACDEAAGCTDAATAATTADTPGPRPLQVAELPNNILPNLAPREVAATAPARVATVAEARPAGALVMRSDGAGAGTRASKDERGRAEQSAASEQSSVWLMLLAGLAFAGFVITKRVRG